MNILLDGMKTKTGRTANGAITHTSSLDDCLDFFFLAGASREMAEADVVAMFSKALASDKNLALKIAFWARDIRGGAGERRLFRIILKYLAKEHNEIFNTLLPYVAEYGRWDDLFFDKEILKYTLNFIKDEIKNLNNKGLLYKWLPREKSKMKDVAIEIRKALSLSSKEYRKLLVNNSSTVENLLSEKKRDKIDYKSVPSKAFNLYRRAFLKNDKTRFESFLKSVEEGKEKVKADAIFPVDIYRSYIKGGDSKSINAQWNSLPNYLEDNIENIMPVCDVSGSMGWLASNYGGVKPIDVSISLGVYISERTEGPFKNHFISFCGEPKLQSINGSVTDRFNQIKNGSSDMSTNIQGVFDELLMVAVRDGIKEANMPHKLLIISDMEFNETNCETVNFDVIKEKYNKAGYKMPTIIFWNVNGRLDNVPAQKTDENVAIISGYSPSILKSVLGGEKITPISVMLKAIKAYSFIDNII